MKLIVILIICYNIITNSFVINQRSTFTQRSTLCMHKDVNKLSSILLSGLISVNVLFPTLPSWGLAQQYKLPPIDRADTNRCVLSSSSMGQANAARDKLYDLRECDLKG